MGLGDKLRIGAVAVGITLTGAGTEGCYSAEEDAPKPEFNLKQLKGRASDARFIAGPVSVATDGYYTYYRTGPVNFTRVSPSLEKYLRSLRENFERSIAETKNQQEKQRLEQAYQQKISDEIAKGGTKVE